MPGIFISYRRQDSQSAAGRLADSLKEQLAEAAIFRDVETIEAGVDFVQAINAALASCGVLLAVIGPRWSTIQDAAGQRRLDDPNDYTRLEIATALGRSDVRVIPVLVDGAAMPAAETLPEDLKPLARRNALELTDQRWDYDVARLVATLRNALGLRPPPPPRAWRGLGAAAGALAVAGLGYFGWHGWEPAAPQTDTPAPTANAPAAPGTVAMGTAAAPAAAKQESTAPPIPMPETGALAPTAGAQAEPCPTRLSINRDLPTPFTCRCDAAAMREGAVWGSDIYTDDSGLCRAALHAGVIPAAGGTLTVLREAGRALYTGSRRNGIRTSDYGAYSDSIRFAGTPRPDPGPEPCPTRLSINRDLPTPYTCRCAAADMREGAVWGSDVYTDDSGLCRAALHAGAIPAAGGTVTVLRLAGRPLYSGSRRNGVQSSDYGAYSDSIRFQTRGGALAETLAKTRAVVREPAPYSALKFRQQPPRP